jgi:hypothetical protein
MPAEIHVETKRDVGSNPAALSGKQRVLFPLFAPRFPLLCHNRENAAQAVESALEFSAENPT